MILILSGPVRSYKTTTLMHWAERRHDCGGVLSPDVDGLRRLYNVYDKSGIPWQKEHIDTPSDEQIGRFVFDSRAFHQAQHWLDDHLADPHIRYLILDEVGPLEMSGKGWDPWLRRALPRVGNKTLILVVRDALVEAVVDKYSLTGLERVSREYFAVD